MIWQIALTVAAIAWVIGWLAVRFDSPFPGVITRWTYVMALAQTTIMMALATAIISIVWTVAT